MDEVAKHLKEIEIDHNNTYLIQVDQWRAREHNTVNVNPVFVQFLSILWTHPFFVLSFCCFFKLRRHGCGDRLRKLLQMYRSYKNKQMNCIHWCFIF